MYSIKTLKNLYGFLPLGVMVFVLLYNPLKSSLCPFVLKIRAHRHSARHAAKSRKKMNTKEHKDHYGERIGTQRR